MKSSIKSLDDIKKLAQEYDALMGERNTMLDAIEKIYLVEDDAVTEDASQGIKRTLSPDGRDAVLGITRILSASEPRFRQPDEQDVATTKESKATKLEQLCAALWNSMSEMNGSPLHFDLALSGSLYGEVQLVIEPTESAGGRTDAQAKRVIENNPISGRVINPKAGWPVFDRFGLAGYYSKQDFRWAEIRSRFDVTSPDAYKDTEVVTVCEWWDYDQHLIWMDGENEALLQEPNTNELIPVACGVIEGSRLFENGIYNKFSRQPFLYSLYKTGLWNRQNLYLTALYSQVFALGRFAKLVYYADEDGKAAPDVDNSQNGIITIHNTEKILPLIQQLIDPQLQAAGQFAFEKGEQTSIYKQVLGQPMGSGMAFSTVSLLSQSGRLPVIPIQRMCSFVIKNAINNALMLLKKRGGSFMVAGVKYSAADIPDDPTIECELEASLPQDDRMNAMIAQQLTQGDNPLTSMEYARSKILKIEQDDIEQKRIWREQAARIKITREMAIQMQEAQAQLDQAMMPPQQQMQQQGMPPQGQPPQGQPMPQQQQPGMMPGPDSTGAGMGVPGVPMAGPEMPMEGGMPNGSEQYPM